MDVDADGAHMHLHAHTCIHKSNNFLVFKPIVFMGSVSGAHVHLKTLEVLTLMHGVTCVRFKRTHLVSLPNAVYCSC